MSVFPVTNQHLDLQVPPIQGRLVPWIFLVVEHVTDDFEEVLVVEMGVFAVPGPPGTERMACLRNGRI